MSATTKVTSSHFAYDGHAGLTVDDVPRCDPAALRAHLKFVESDPLLTKDGKPRKRLNTARADQPTGFYVAQMIHYGLKRPTATIARDDAKAMLRVLDAGTGLHVPDEVAALETKLKRKWETANAKVKKPAADAPQAATTSKRKRTADDGRGTQIIVTNVFIGGAQDGAGSSSAPKKAKIEGTARPTKAKAAPPALPPPKEKVCRISTTLGGAEDHGAQKTSPPIDLTAIAGYYFIVAPTMTKEWPLPPKGVIKFALAPSTNGSHLWGEFDFGPVAGRMRSCTTLTPANRVVRFLWRGHDLADGYTRASTLSISFREDGTIKGTFAWVGKYEFTGTRNPNYPNPGHKVLSWKQMYWAHIPDGASLARGGGRQDAGPSTRGEAEPNSDTDDDAFERKPQGGEWAGASAGRTKQTAVRSRPFNHDVQRW